MNLASMQKRLEKLEAVKGQTRLRVFTGQHGGDFDAEIGKAVASGWARKTDLFVYVNRYSDDWTPESTTPAALAASSQS
jgi:hypothetical protein